MPSLCQGLALQGIGVPERTNPCNPGVSDQVESAALRPQREGSRRKAGTQTAHSGSDGPASEMV